MFCFTGCSGQNDSVSYDQETMQDTADLFIGSFSQMSDDDFETYKEKSDLELDLIMLQNSLPIESDDFLQLIETWQTAVEDYGTLVSYEEGTVAVKNSGIELSMDAVFSDRTATIVMVFDEDGQVENMAVSGDYTIGEILTKAGLNTLIGMGTVFAVLIFISFIIYLLGFVPKLMEGKKNKPAQDEEKVKTLTSETYTAEEEEMDDLELVAVISAAIAAAEGTSADGFVVRSIKRRKSNKWI
jgi:sodium pump decarboxylase gamma subunit